MSNVLIALAPVFLLIAVGWAARASRLLSEETFGAVNRFGYFVPYPAFLFTTVAGADLHADGAGAFLAACFAGFFAMTLIAFATKAFIADGPQFTSVFQGAVRWNGFVILAAGNALWGPRGSEMVALAFGPLVLFVNLVCVAVLARFGTKRLLSKRAIAAQLVGNPLILACFAGLIFNAASVHELGPVSETLAMIGSSALPLALICVGAGLAFGPLRRGWTLIATSTSLKLLVAPAVMFAMARLFGLDPAATAICVGVGATSTAAASYTLAREMGGDAQMMAGIVTTTTLLSFITLPIAIGLTAPA